MKKRPITSLLVFLIVGISVFSFASVSPRTNYPVLSPIETMKPNGEFGIYVYQSGNWLEVKRLSFDKYLREQTVDLEQYLTSQYELKVRIVQRGGTAAHIDSVFLGGLSPKAAGNSKEKESLKKLSQKDFDVIDAYGKTLDFIFPSKALNKNLSVTARIEPEKISKIPFQFPRANFYKKIDRNSAFYPYSIKETKIRKRDSNKPFFTEFCRAGTGHPYGFAYGWVWNDDNYLYVKLDLTPDNTMDGLKDWAKVYVNTGKAINEFKVSINNTRWGTSDFTYTEKVDYEHKVYDFKIPLKEIAAHENQILLAFAFYGTLALTPPIGMGALPVC